MAAGEGPLQLKPLVGGDAISLENAIVCKLFTDNKIDIYL